MLLGVIKTRFLPVVFTMLSVGFVKEPVREIPEPSGKASTLNLTSHKQDIIRIAIKLSHASAELSFKGKKTFDVP